MKRERMLQVTLRYDDPRHHHCHHEVPQIHFHSLSFTPHSSTAYENLSQLIVSIA